MKKCIKVLAFLIAAALILGVLYLVSLFAGTPWGWINALIVGHQTMEEFKEDNYRIAGMGYDFKFGDYYITMRSPDHIDGDFQVIIDRNITTNTYEDRVLGLKNTANRINDEYRKKAMAMMAEFETQYDVDFNVVGGCYIKLHDADFGYKFDGLDKISPDAISINDLELDKEYDVQELAKTNGYLWLSLRNEAATFDRAAEILLSFKNMADEKGISFYAVELSITPAVDPLTNTLTGERIYAPSFLYSDIYEEGLADRIQAAHDAEVERQQKEWEERNQESEE